VLGRAEAERGCGCAHLRTHTCMFWQRDTPAGRAQTLPFSCCPRCQCVHCLQTHSVRCVPAPSRPNPTTAPVECLLQWEQGGAGKDCVWADLTPAQRAAAGRLGWAEASWDEGVELDSCGQWAHLSQARVQDATLLGWDQCVVPRHVPRRAMAAISYWVMLHLCARVPSPTLAFSVLVDPDRKVDWSSSGRALFCRRSWDEDWGH
jgi:hypothetical protein